MQKYIKKNYKMILGVASLSSVVCLSIIFVVLGDYMSAEEGQPKQAAPLVQLNDGLALPANGEVRSNFGSRSIMGNESDHFGIDISSSENEKVFAVAGGVVTKVFSDCIANGHVGSVCGNGYGNYIQIQHEVNGQKFETLYAHLSETFVDVGDNIKKNEEIAMIGSSGNAAGKSLHFELHIPKKENQLNAVDPLLYIQLKSR